MTTQQQEQHQEEVEEEEEEWSVRGYYWEDEEHIVDDDYFKSFKKLHEASIFYNSITKEKCNAGKVLYKEPYEEELILLEENYDEEEECDRCGREDVLECHSSKCIDHDNKEDAKEYYDVEVVLKDKEWTEYQVEYGYMIDEETYDSPCSDSYSYDNKEVAKEYYDMLVSNNEYDYVRLVERHMEGGDCMDDETIEEWDPEEHKKNK